MKLYLYFVIPGILICFVLGLPLFFIQKNTQKNFSFLSPIPEFLTIAKNEEVSTLDLFEPIIQRASASMKEIPFTTAQSALVYDLTTQQTLYEKNSTSRHPMASLTKIMTAIIALENKKENDLYTVAKENLVGENSMGVTEGEALTLRELLYGLMLSSGNDAAEVFATNYPLGRDKFIQAMNNKAKSLGLTDTNFTNPSGLQGDGNQYTTVRDLLIITNYAITRFPLFNNVVETAQITLPQTRTHKEFYLTNETNLLTTYPGVKGIKTGFTPEAGLCLVTRLEYKGHNIIGILLGSNNRRGEMKELLDFSLKELSIQPPAHE